MEQFVGLDISQAMTHLCVVNGKGKKVWQGKCPTKPDDIAKTIRDKAPSATLIGLESGACQCAGQNRPLVCGSKPATWLCGRHAVRRH